MRLEQELFDFLRGTSGAAFSLNQQGEIPFWNRSADENPFG